MAPLCWQEEEILALKVQGFSVLDDKIVKGLKKIYMAQNVWEVPLAESYYS